MERLTESFVGFLGPVRVLADVLFVVRLHLFDLLLDDPLESVVDEHVLLLQTTESLFQSNRLFSQFVHPRESWFAFTARAALYPVLFQYNQLLQRPRAN